MNKFSTELKKALQESFSLEGLDEIFRAHLENALQDLLNTEADAFFGYEKYDVEGYGSGNSRNGFYKRTLDTKYGKIIVDIPRDRNGEFKQKLIPSYTRRTDDLETTIITLYQKGITTREISDIIEKMYGHHYSSTTVSNISKAVEEQVTAFHSRKLSEQYVAVFMDATYLNVRRNSVAKEPLHIMLGITPDGTREILDYKLFPTESAANYEEMMSTLKERGVKQVLLFASDGLQGMRDAVKRQFPAAEHQQCWVHLSRTVERYIRRTDRPEMLDELKKVYRAGTREEAANELDAFLEKYKTSYKKLASIFERVEPSLFQYYAFPKEIRYAIYTTNLIETSNKALKHKTKVKEQFTNEDSLDRFVCCIYSEQNRRYAGRAQRGFKKVSAELLEMFDALYGGGSSRLSEETVTHQREDIDPQS